MAAGDTDMTSIKIVYAAEVEIEDGAFVVEAKTADGRWFQHQGPQGFAYFTAEQADRLVWRILSTLRIDTQFWTDGEGGFHGTAAHEYALLETEYYEG
jgi:hypothetical protein